MSDLELLDNVIHEIGNISVPIGWTETIGIPLYNAGQKLVALKQLLVNQRKEQITKTEETPSEEKIEG